MTTHRSTGSTAPSTGRGAGRAAPVIRAGRGPAAGARSPADVRRAVGTVLVLGAWNDLVVPRLPGGPRGYVPANLAATAALLRTARAAGLTWAELGLARERLASGARWGSAAAVPVAVGYAAALASPAARPLLADARVAGLGGREVTARALVRIPLGTVLWEEVAFRGVLLAVLGRVLPPPAAGRTAAAVFGLWHVTPTLQALTANDLAPGRLRRAGAVLAACAGTAAAGVLFTTLRRRSGSLLAPALLHLAANDLGLLAAAVATRRHG